MAEPGTRHAACGVWRGESLQRFLRPGVQDKRGQYGRETDSRYVHLSERPGADAEAVADEVVLDLDEDGVLVGIDRQHVSQRINVACPLFEQAPA